MAKHEYDYEILAGRCSECGEPSIMRLPILDFEQEAACGEALPPIPLGEIVGCDHMTELLTELTE